MTRSRCPGFADPLDAKVHSVLAIGQADDLVEVEPDLYTAQLGSLLANVHRSRFLGEDLTTAAGAEDTHRHLDLFARLAAPAHSSGTSPSFKEPCKIRPPNCAGDDTQKQARESSPLASNHYAH